MPGDKSQLASYRSPVGRLAALPVGEDLQLSSGQVVEVVERAMLRPIRVEQEWDSKDSLLHGENYGPLTVESLRALLARTPSEEIDERLLEELLEEESQLANITEGIRRAVLTQMELRDQPVLDKFQDEIFRLPLDSSILLLGPPGTGKTTTLIRRLGQKLDLEFLSEDEQSLAQRLEESAAKPHETSWLMFTPTSLLQQYVKESFSREKVPASDHHVQTWADYRLKAARNVFGLLRTSAKRGGFVLRDSVEYFGDEALSNLIGWFDDFEAWQQSAYIKRLQNAAKQLVSIGDDKTAELGEALTTLIKSNDSVDIDWILRGLYNKATDTRKIADELKSEIDEAIRRVLVLQVNRNRSFLDELAEFLDSLDTATDQPLEEGEIGDEDESEDDDEEEEETPQTRRRSAALAFRRALRTQARAAVRGRKLKSDTTTARIINWIGDRGLDEDKQVKVGKSVVLLSLVRTFVNPARLYFNGIAARYRSYRRTSQSNDRWYLAGTIRQTDIHPLELDMLLLSILKGARSLLSSREVQRNLQSAFWAVLQPVQESFRNQIFADEATDFSPVQLACMSALSPPTINSFFACGDFNQRLSSWGTRSAAEIAWVDSRIGIERVTIGYRHSRELNEFAREIVRIGGGTDYEVVLPQHANREGVPPVLAENMRNDPEVSTWLADRVMEIERFIGQVPSIAILVPKEDQVEPIATALRDELAEQNINVVACPNGQVIGQDNDIRVFDVQHIKGLEFEVVFFVDVDRLAGVYPDLFDKFLYVGATRAATYLGLTCSGSLPSAISSLRSMFSTKWSG
ncbi:MAG: DNA helicase UvrD [Gammaproteobacteria bacterium]|nr:DNA helicase UvrD [Gammaproteobacteria bacterium]MYG97022.1 DNA helicase UvrD [Gammaproteobacteria bacterium]